MWNSCTSVFPNTHAWKQQECLGKRSCMSFTIPIAIFRLVGEIKLTEYNHWILTFHSIYDYFALLKAFNTNTLNFHQYFKHKLSSHQPSHMNNTKHRTNNNFNTALFNHSKTPKCYLYQVIPIWNSQPSSLKNCTSKFTFKKQIKSHLLASQF